MTSDPHAPLRDDVHLLGDTLGGVLRTHEGEALFARVEEVRTMARAARGGDRAAGERLAALLAGLSPAEILGVSRAFAHFLTLANLAEQHHRVRRRRVHRGD